jgi:DNA-binding CsgD family transcriptional regulator
MLPVFYLLLVFIIDSLIPIIISFAISVIGLVLLYTSYGYQMSFLLMAVSLIFVLLLGVYIQYRISAHKTIITTNPTLVQSIDNNGQDFSKINELREILTKKEFEIVYYAIKGLSNEEIATKLFIEETTIKFHLKNIFKKLNITSKVDLTNLFISPKILEKFESSLHDNHKNGEDKGNLPKSIV